MALDALAEIVVRAVGNFFLEVIIVKIFYWPGWLVLRVITLGRYPPADQQARHRGFVGFFGFVIVIVAILFKIPGGGL